jgi:hypothetical protein
MKTTTLAALAVVALGLAATAACAQSTSSESKPFTIKIGANLPTSSGAKDISNTWIAGGVDYVPPATAGSGAPGAQSLVYADYTSASKNGLNAHYLAIGVGTRTKSSTAASGSGIFYEGGLGAYLQSAKNSSGQSKNGTAFGVKSGIGLALGQSLFVEGTYTWISSKVNGVDLSGFGGVVGMRF